MEIVAPSHGSFTVINWIGGKTRRLKQLLPLMPVNSEVYIEPYFGAGSVFFARKPVKKEIVNDLYDNVITFFRVLRERPDELARSLALTPVSHAEYTIAHNSLIKKMGEPQDDLEKARKFYVLCRLAFAGRMNSSSPRRPEIMIKSKRNYVSQFYTPLKHFGWYAQRLRNAHISKEDALHILSKVKRDDIFAYVDPPYIRKGQLDDYVHEVTIEHHEKLLQILNKFPGLVALSGYPNELYNDYLSHWPQIVTLKAKNTSVEMKQGQKRPVMPETLFCNYDEMYRKKA